MRSIRYLGTENRLIRLGYPIVISSCLLSSCYQHDLSKSMYARMTTVFVCVCVLRRDDSDTLLFRVWRDFGLGPILRTESRSTYILHHSLPVH
jgi:hypothetical protein